MSASTSQLNRNVSAASTMRSTSRLPDSGTAMAPEHVTRVLHMIDADLNELISVDDLCAFVRRCNLPFDDGLLASMFGEANVTHDGLLTEDQLQKAVGGRFPYRQHNQDWVDLFEAAPSDPATRRLTTLPMRQPEREQILASFEQEREILTFTPTMWSSARPGSRTASRGRLHITDELPAVRHGFDQLADFDVAVEALERASAVEGWRERLQAEVASPPPPSRIYFGMHHQPWKPSNQPNVIPTRVDGEITRTGPHGAPARWQMTENQGPARGSGLANSRTARLHGVHDGAAPFISVFGKVSLQNEQCMLAKTRVEMKGRYISISIYPYLSLCISLSI